MIMHPSNQWQENKFPMVNQKDPINTHTHTKGRRRWKCSICHVDDYMDELRWIRTLHYSTTDVYGVMNTWKKDYHKGIGHWSFNT